MPKIFLWNTLTAVFLVIVLGARIEAENPATDTFTREIRPLLKTFCYRCHNEKKSSADLRLNTLNSDLITGSDAETWHDVLNKLNLGEMPPENQPQPTSAQRQLIVDWLTKELRRAADLKRTAQGNLTVRRLTRYEYANTMRDLLGIDLDYAADLPPEPTSPEGFRNNAAMLGMSSLHLEYYLNAARTGLQKALGSGEKPEIFSHHAEKSLPAGGRRKKVPVGNRMGPGSLFIARMDEFPREGEFVIRIRAGARVPEGMAYPRLSVSVGVRADVLSPQRVVGEADVSATLASSAVYEFRGRIEEFPLPGENPKYPGMVMTLTHIGKAPVQPKGKKNKRNKKNKEPVPVDPSQPLIVVESVDFEGPIFDAWPPTSRTRILGGFDPKEDELPQVRGIVHKFMERAFRRPVTESEVEPLMKLFMRVRPQASSYEIAIRDVLAMVLISPDFLYIIEPHDETAESPNRQSTQYYLASRLSYFLWSTMPDSQLMQLAEAGSLNDPAILENQVRMMLQDERSWSFVEQFTNQWLDLSGLDRVAVNPEFYPDFDDRLKSDMRMETQKFFGEILTQDLTALNLIDSNFTMLNQPLAQHYGIQGPRGTTFERVELKPEDHRGGLLTNASILLGNSTGEDSHPIRRAVWLLDRLLNDPPPPPPPDVPELESTKPEFANLSLKKQLELHRTKDACNNCHRGIDPWGIPLENYDAVGLWRTHVTTLVGRRKKRNRTEVDASTVLHDGQRVSSVDELKRHLLKHERSRFSRAVVTKLMSYALGRSPGLADFDTIDRLAGQFEQDDYRLSGLIVAIVQSAEFQRE